MTLTLMVTLENVLLDTTKSMSLIKMGKIEGLNNIGLTDTQKWHRQTVR